MKTLIKKVKVKVGETECDKSCSYWSGHPSEHSCGKPIYEDGFKCLICGKEFTSEASCKAHITIKHKD